MTAVIIPCYNLLNRGLQRLYFSILSLQGQDCKVWVVDGSDDIQFLPVEEMVTKLGVEYLRYPTGEFNMPRLHNYGIKCCTEDWIMTTGADFLFRGDFLEECKLKRSENRMLFKEVGMLGKTNITEARITKWMFPKTRLNEWKHEANGGCQYTHKQWFLENPYDEVMSGFSGMDNLCAYKAYVSGLDLHWIKESEILHIWHDNYKYKNREDNSKTKRNHAIVSEFCKQHGLTKEVLKGNMYQNLKSEDNEKHSEVQRQIV